MPNLTSAISQAIRGKIGWNSIAVAISVLIVAIAAITLWRLIHEIEPRQIIAALKAQPPHGIFIACGFVLAGYFMLACYDIFALRVTGWRAVPMRIAAFASFTSYTIGHNFGAPVFTSNVLRYRIYSALGLSVVDVARIAFITGQTYWLGNMLMLGCGVLYVPAAASAIDHLPASINRVLGILGLMAVASYLVWLLPRRRVIGRANWRIVLPTAQMTLVQIVIGTLDLIFVSLAMYVLLPAQPPVGFAELMVIFVTSMLIGIVSHAPGSLGVIEAAMFIGLAQFQKEQLLASLLTFRILYFVGSLCLAALVLGLREFSLLVQGAIKPLWPS